MTTDSLVVDVHHRTHTRYAARVDVAHHLAHLSPLSDAAQQVLAHALTIDPLPARRQMQHDVFGNLRTCFTIDAPHEEFVVDAHSRVVLTPAAAPSVSDYSPPWEEVAESMRYVSGRRFEPTSEFVFASPHVPLLPQARSYAAELFAPGRPWLDLVLDLMRVVHGDLQYEPGVTDVHTPLAAVFAQRHGVCQDYAHLMIGVLRARGLPARYVSGYLLTRPAPGRPRLLGADASHAWVQAWSPSQGWLDLDPTNDLVPHLSHVRLAVGRDYSDVPPLRGVIRGGGEHRLKVAVSVIPEDEADCQPA
ncbi:MAG TPA: transglutaminase family protein [Burkholderiaceae bacterium]|nr:transglutaminase family protein [Burkholderiaceae bacterium]